MNYKTFYIHGLICFLVQLFITIIYQGFPGSSDGKESAFNTGDSGSVPGSGRSPGEGHGNPLQYYCQENPIPWTEEPGGLQSMGLQRVGHD